MSASREKKTRQDPSGQGLSEKKLKQQQEGRQTHVHHIVYTVLAVLVVLFGVGLLIWNSNFFQSRAAAVTIDGQDYTAADVQYYYNGALQQEIYNSYSGASTMDYTLDPEDQIYDESTGETWRDHLLDVAIQTLTQQAAIANEAQASGYTMSAQAQESLQNTLDSIQAGTITSGYGSKDAYVRANYGPTMSYDKFVQIMERYYLAADYAQSQVDSYTYDDSQLDAYYEEHADELDTFTLSQFVFQARVNTVDDEGNTIEMTDEEKAAALEEEKAAVKEQAEALQARLEAGEDPEALAEEFSDSIYSSEVALEQMGSTVNSEYSEWAYDSARRPGDITLVEYAGGSSESYNYCVALFHDRVRGDAPTADVRHILIGAADANITPTEEQYEQAKAKAEELLAQWEAGDATEDSFAQLAQENSADTSSASNGGLLQYVSPYSGYVDTLPSGPWTQPPARRHRHHPEHRQFRQGLSYHVLCRLGRPRLGRQRQKRPEQRAVQPVGRKTGQCLHCHPGQRSEICGVILPINTSGARCFKHRAPSLSLFFPMLRLFVKLPEGQIHVHISLDPGHRGGVGVLPQVEVVEEAGAALYSASQKV